MEIVSPPPSAASSQHRLHPPSASHSASFLETVRKRLGGSSFALPELADEAERRAKAHDDDKDDDGQDNSDEDYEEDVEELMWDAQKALISHDSALASTLYRRALRLPPRPSASTALALGNLLVRGGGGAAGGSSANGTMLSGVPPPSSSQSTAPARGRREWEVMNEAGACYLVGLAAEAEVYAAGPGWRYAKGKGKARDQLALGGGVAGDTRTDEGEEKLLTSTGILEAERDDPAHESALLMLELVSALLMLYRRGLLQPSDPPVPLPVNTAPVLLRPDSGGHDVTANVWALGNLAARRLLEAAWLSDEDKDEDEDESVGAARGPLSKRESLLHGIKMHLLYLLALISHTVSPADSLAYFRRLLRYRSRSNTKEAAELAISAEKRAAILETRLTSAGARESATTSKSPSARNGHSNGQSKGSRVSGLGGPEGSPFAISPAPLASTGVEVLPAFPFPRQQPLLPLQAKRTVSTTIAFPSPANCSLRHGRKDSASSSLLSFEPSTTHHHTKSQNQRTSVRSSATARSTMSVLSLRIAQARASAAEGVVDDAIVEGVVDAGVRRGWSWFGSAHGARGSAMGSLKRFSSAGTISAPDSVRGPATVPLSHGTRARLPSGWSPPITPTITTASGNKDAVASSSSVSSSPPDPSSSTRHLFPPKTNSRLLTYRHSQMTSPLAAPPVLRPALSNPHLTEFGDPSLDPQLRQLEMDSRITRGAACDVCGTRGVNLPECPKCRLRFCSRECRVGKLAAGDGKRHICEALERRRKKGPSTAEAEGEKETEGKQAAAASEA